jgi:hypothetical protein
VKIGLITHISGKIRRHAPGGSIGEKELPRWQLQLHPQSLTGSTAMFSFCSHRVKTNRERR